MATFHVIAGASETPENPAIRKIGIGDLRQALIKGWQDFAAFPSQALFIVLIYPIVGFVLMQLAIGNATLPGAWPRHALDARIRCLEESFNFCNRGFRRGATHSVFDLDGVRAINLYGPDGSLSPGVDPILRAGRFDDRRRMDAHCCRQRSRFHIRRAGTRHRRDFLSDAGRSRRGSRRRGMDVNPRRYREPDYDGSMGIYRWLAVAARVAAVLHRAGGRHALARTRELASLSSRGRPLTHNNLREPVFQIRKHG
jgi:hypothetical protein